MENNNETLLLPYVNYKGNYEIREVTPCKVNYYTDNTFHGEGWILKAFCHKKKEFRDFNFEGIIKGIAHHTLRSVQTVSTPERLEGIFRNIVNEIKTSK